MSIQPAGRRNFLVRAAMVASAGILSAQPIFAYQELMSAAAKADNKEDEEVTPSEDLMREHGVLRRVLLVYDELIRRVEAKEEIDPKLLEKSADIIKRFVEDYHEKQEEIYVFPRLQKAGKEADLVAVLLQQHAAGRVVTQRIRALATSGGLRSVGSRAQLKELLQSFERMYRPHAAREDTVLFPAFRSVLSRNEYDSLGEEFEKNETKMFGEGGFEQFVDQVATIEKALDLYDLRRFTPKV